MLHKQYSVTATQ